MEDLTIIILVLGSLGTIFLGINFTKIKQFHAKKLPKKTNNEIVQEVSTSNIRTLQESYTMQIKQLREELTSTQRSLSRYKQLVRELKEKEDLGMEDDEDVEDDSIEALQQQYQIDPKKAIEFATKLNLNPAGLNNPALTPVIWQKIKENFDLAVLLGIIRPKQSNGLAQPTAEISTGQTSSIETVFTELQKSNQLA